MSEKTFLIELEKCENGALQEVRLRDAFTTLTQTLGEHATALAKKARDVAQRRVQVATYDFPIIACSEVADELDDLRRRVMVLAERTARLAHGGERLMVELPKPRES